MFKYKGLSQGFFVRTLSATFSSRYCSFCGSNATRRSEVPFFAKTANMSYSSFLVKLLP